MKIRNRQPTRPPTRAGPAASGGPQESANAIGLLELTSIAKGIEATDLMLKAADVELLVSRSICSGKYMVLVRGDVAACASSVAAGEEVGRETVADSIVIPNLHDESSRPSPSPRPWRRWRPWASSRPSTWPPSSRGPTPP